MAFACFASNGNAQTDMTSRISDPDFEQEGRSQWKTNMRAQRHSWSSTSLQQSSHQKQQRRLRRQLALRLRT